MNKRLLIFTLFITCVYTTSLFAQDRLGVYAAAFYNLENLWDTVDDPNNEGDDDFTPEGIDEARITGVNLVNGEELIKSLDLYYPGKYCL